MAETQLAEAEVLSVPQSMSVLPANSEKCEVGFRVGIREITHISTAQQSYGVKGVLKMSWCATDDDIERNNDAAEYNPSFVPSVEWTNDIETHSYDIGSVALKKHEESGISYNTQSIKFNKTFTEKFEVKNFPFDVQDLSIVFHESKHNVWVPHHTYTHFLKLDKAWSSITDWDMDRIAAASADIPYRSGRKGSGKSYQKVCVKIQAKRKWKGVIYRLISWLFMLGVMSWATFSVHPSDIGNRLSYAVTMALTIVAFQFIISDQLPQVNYMTLLDRYNLFIFVFILMVTIESSLVGYHGEGVFQDSETLDNYFAIASGVWFFCGNLAFAVCAKRARGQELAKLSQWQPYRIDSLHVPNNAFTKCSVHVAQDRF